MSRRRTRHRSRVLLVVALLLLLVGVAALAFVGWEVYGTTAVSKHRQKQVVAAVERQWQHPARRAPKLSRGVLALVRIPRFGHTYVVPVLQGTAPDSLARGLGHYTETAGPGQAGNFALAGHRITHGEPFRHLPDLRPGDTVIVETRTRELTYRVDTDPNHLELELTDNWVLARVPRNPESGGVQPPTGQPRLITLTTCADLFHSSERLVAFGHLVKSRASARNN